MAVKKIERHGNSIEDEDLANPINVVKKIAEVNEETNSKYGAQL